MRAPIITDAEIAGFMGWRGPGAYTRHSLLKIKEIVAEVQRRESEACANLARDYFDGRGDSGLRISLSKLIRERNDP